MSARMIKLATLDKNKVDFISVSIIDGEELECYCSNRLHNTKLKDHSFEEGEILELIVDESDVESYVQQCVKNCKLIKVEPGTFDFVSGEEIKE